MKTMSFKWRYPRMERSLAAGLVCMLLSISAGTANAQVFNPSIHPEYPFPTPAGVVNSTNHSFTYTMSHIAYMTNNPTPPPAIPYMKAPPGLPNSDLSIHCWDNSTGTTGGIGYFNTATGSGTPPPVASIYDQGFVAYPATARNIEASLLQDEMGVNNFIWGTTAPWYVVVSYYNSAGPGGAGHYYDTYIWNQPPPNGPGGLTLVATTQLSAIPTYTRISQDAHNTYGFCITWENPTAAAPGNGINFVFGFMNGAIPGPSVSPAYLLPGTAGQTKPDVAFMHASTLNLHFVYYRQVFPNIKITESTIPMQTGPAWAPPPAPVVNDINTIPYPCDIPVDIKTRIDAPDHGSSDWAYTYILPPNCSAINRDIFVRYNNAGISTTYTLTNGSMGILACNTNPAGTSFLNDWPVCSFDNTVSQLNVEWYTQYQKVPGTGFFLPASGGYIGLRMSNTGAIVSAPDYLQVANSATGSQKQASRTPTIASSRQNDRTDYQFVTFANTNGATRMIVKDRQWVWPSFKSTDATHNNLSSLYGNPDAAGVTDADKNVVVYPNPFSNQLSVTVSAELEDEVLKVNIEDISGRIVGSFQAKGRAINESLTNVAPQLANGTYVLRVQSATGSFTKTVKVAKVSAE